MMRVVAPLARAGRRLGRDTSGLALMEFAFSLPILLTLSLTGAELANYVITRMRVSQVALHIADNAARIGSGSQLEAKKIDEAQINDLLTGADLQGGDLDLVNNSRVILSSVQPKDNTDTNNKFLIQWQRCHGNRIGWKSTYGKEGDEKTDGIGPAGRLVNAPPFGVVMFVEIRYEYQPIVSSALAPSADIREVASMMVRDRRDTSDDSDKGAAATHPKGVYKVAGVNPATCPP